MDTNFSSPQLATILAVDDQILNLTVLTQLLKKYYNVVCMESGETALEYLGTNSPPSLILLDVMMPGLNGFDVCKLIKNNPKISNIPVIFITALTGTEDEKLALSIGAVDFISKPFDPPIALARINTHINLRRKIKLLENLSLLDELLTMPNKQYFEYYLQRSWKKIYNDNRFIGMAFTRVITHSSDNAISPELDLFKTGEILCRACSYPESVVCYLGKNIFATLIISNDSETILKITKSMQIYLESQSQRELGIASKVLKISTGLAITRYNNEKFPLSLRTAAESNFKVSADKQCSSHNFELLE